MNIMAFVGIILLAIGLVKTIGYIWAGLIFLALAVWAQS